MPELLTINSENILSPTEDYDFLRKEGISYLQSLSGDIWTDYNSHDPGITLLEALCYALTDLGYRTSFDIEEILASGNKNKAISEVGFYRANQILNCNPVTLTDYRKLIIDTEGVRNAWIEVCDTSEVPIFMKAPVDKKNPNEYGLTYNENLKYDIVQLRGLYKVFVELEDEVTKEKRGDEVVKLIKEKLHNHRNLCEDFVSISPIEYQLFPIEIDIKAREGFDIERINAEVFHVIHDFFAPPIRFYSFDEMVAKGYSHEEIFEGPALKYGFLVDDELTVSERYRDIHLSDIINLLLDIEGVMAINKLTLPMESQSPFSNFTYWINDLKLKQKAPKLDIDNSVVTFFKSSDQYRDNVSQKPDKERVKLLFSFLQSANKRTKLKKTKSDSKIPNQEKGLDLIDFFPFQKDLPPCYGTQETYLEEFKGNNSDRLKWFGNQINALKSNQKMNLQLRGYLAIYEQIMLNHLSQLSNVSQLFSLGENVENSDIYLRNFSKNIQENPVYSHENLKEINDLEALFLDYPDYLATQSKTNETESEYKIRKNAFLDHSMAMFGEKLPDYKFSLSPLHSQDLERKVLFDKIFFLQDYIELSNYRGKGYDYTDCDAIWDTKNVEGFKKRVCRLLGIEDYSRRQIAHQNLCIREVKVEQGIIRYEVILSAADSSDNKKVLLRSILFEFLHEAQIILNYIMNHGHRREHYDFDSKKRSYEYFLKMKSQESDYEVIAEMSFEDEEVFNDTFKTTIATINKFAEEENFHVVEHILLRPKIGSRARSDKKYASSVHLESVTLMPIIEQDFKVDLENIITPTEQPKYKFNIKNIEDKSVWKLSFSEKDGGDVLIVKDDFIFYKDLTKRIKHLREVASDIEFYEIKKDSDGRFMFRIIDEEIVLAEGKVKQIERKDLEKTVEELIHFFSNEIPIGTIVNDEKELDMTSYLDPYSFNISVIIPNWCHRFKDPSFKYLLEKTIYFETPAHISPNIMWVNHQQMTRFESAYKLWLEEQANEEIPNTEILNNLIEVMNEIRNETNK